MIRSIYVHPDDLRKSKVLALREGMSPTAIMRGLIRRGIEAYEREYGVLPIEGVSPYFSVIDNPAGDCANSHS
jgi:hypothetical protein